MSKHKICHITSVHAWNDTRIFYKECCSLAEAGYDVTYVVPNAPEDIVNGVKIISVDNPSKKRMTRATKVAFKVFLKAKRTKAKVIHFHDPELIWVGILLRLLGRKVVFDVHENVIAQIEDKKWMRFKGVVKRVYGFFEFLAAKLFFIVIAENSYDVLFNKNTKDIYRVLNFPDIQKLKGLKTQTGGTGILYVGVVTESRAIIEIFQALHILQEKEVEFTFHCVGGVSDAVKEVIDSSEHYHKVKENVIFHGILPIYEAYKLSDVCALGLSILHPFPNYTRSYSTKIFEYMAIGLPFVVSDFEIYKFVKEEKIGICVDPKNVEQIASSFEDILTRKIDVDGMVNRAKLIVERDYSWNSQKKNLLAMYDKIFKG